MAAPMMPYPTDHHHHKTGHLLCRYRSKLCVIPRAHKRDGSLHRYCEEHRQRANMNQKKWAKRRMQEADESEMRMLQLTYQQMLSLSLARPSAPVCNAEESAPIDAFNFDSLLVQWPNVKVESALQIIEDEACALLWESVVLNGVQL